MNLPLVSIGIPVLNGEKWISRALDSLLNQDYRTIEIVISDNASSDSTFEICKKYAENEGVIQVMRQDVKIGIFDNFRSVLDASHGKYFMWAAVDDSWDPEFISRLVEKLERDEMCAVAQSGTKLYSESNLEKAVGYTRFNGRANLERYSMLGVTRKILSPPKYNYYIYGLFRRDILTEAFKYIPAVPSADRLFLLQFPLAGYKMGYVDAPLYLRTIAVLPSYVRYKDDNYCREVEKSAGKWFDFSGCSAISNMFMSSSLLSGCGYYQRMIVLFQYLLWKSKHGIRLMLRSILVKLVSRSFYIWLMELRNTRRNSSW